MKIIEPSATLVGEINPEEILKKIERCGRVSRQSGGRPLNTYGAKKRTKNFMRMLIERGHESVLEHVSLTFRIICDRAIMAELTRHRIAAFTVESTRYVKYDDLEVVTPFAIDDDDLKYCHWVGQMRSAENAYRTLINHGAKPEEARAVLPNCLKSELYMTANLREWRHILKLRTDKAAHPQMRLIAGQILEVFKEKLPVIVEDINVE